jgi:CRISPR-associated protein Cas5t
MQFCAVELISQTATFRNPEFQNYHKTLEVPLPTTLIGLAGAAMGLTPKQSQSFFDSIPFKIGVWGTSAGKTKDLWKRRFKPTSKDLYADYHPNWTGGNTVVKREILFGNHFVIVFASENAEAIEQLIHSFQYPVYALTMGSSDSLAFVKQVTNNVELAISNKISNCLVEGNVLDEVYTHLKDNWNCSIYQTSEPIAYDLPTKFSYKTEFTDRTVIATRCYSIIGHAMELNYNLDGVLYNDVFIPLANL